MAFRVGIPRGLLYYYYGEIWKRFFEQLGIEAVVSSATTKETIDKGNVIDEVCLPLKVYFGHVCELEEKVDFLFIPRLVSAAYGQYSCPKMMGLPDVVRANFTQAPPLLDMTVNLRKGKYDLYRAVVELGDRLGKKPLASLLAWRKANVFIAETIPEKRQEPAMGVTIGLVGHPYILNDREISQDISGKLAGIGVQVVKPESVTEKEANEAAKYLTKPIFWHYCSRLAGVALSLIYSRRVDGLIFVTSFACGPDSLVGEVVGWHARQNHLPMLMLALDEHSGDTGLVTRLEAFCDMLGRRKQLC
ncbi:MAG: hypothetical protein H6Q67_662 [Firmicutes bacterium]|nr:hypothetical protein [Bacillota bacterium]